MNFSQLYKKYQPVVINGFKNFYIMFALSFFVWMLFFDSNDFISQYRTSKNLREMKKEKAYYESKIEEVKDEQAALFSDPSRLEKFARENYRMKKENEDVFIIVEE
ncbi:septum formation initiator family protein [Cytophagaceae bacterium ABcell3]|nr:septum formation initiator family protein [Cytophagaceae bacterium ABcell3]